MKQSSLLFLTLLFSLSERIVFAQLPEDCEVVYAFIEVMPKYEKGEAEAIKYLMKEISPVISSYNKKNDALVTKVRLDLIIDRKGNIANVDFPKSTISSEFENEIRKKLLLMKGWKAGKMDGVPVCCKLSFPISCILYK